MCIETDWCSKSLGDSYNSLNCQIDTSFRFPNGNYKIYPSKLGGINGCQIWIISPNHKPYLYADHSYHEKFSYCKSYSSYKEDKPYLFNEKTYTSSKQEFEENHEKTPARSPMFLPNGI